MAFLRHANAIVTQPQVTQTGWSKVRSASKVEAQPSANLSAQASEILGHNFDPAKYLLTHCTIVASVTTEEVPGVKLGSLKENGQKINRKYSKYRITADTDQYINSNFDSFDRDVLLKSYRTFIGAQNFQEHVQVEDLSKGRIIDAVARDIGDSVYVDILVATDRKHAQLVSDIEEGRLGTLSMGASVLETTCTKCGNVAVDETELCSCVKYAKGNTFLDERGKKHRIAELCGAPELDPTGGVTFIEASWVGTPAFTGAVMRNIIVPAELSAAALKKAQTVLSSPPPEWILGSNTRQAKQVKAWGDEGDAPETPAAPPPPVQPLHDLEDRVMRVVMDQVEKRFKEEIDKRNPAPNAEDSTMAPNDNLVKEAYRKAYNLSLGVMAKTATSDASLIQNVAMLDSSFGVRLPIEVYRTALSVGNISKYGSVENYLKVCRETLGRSCTGKEAQALIRLGRLTQRFTSNPVRTRSSS